MDVERWGWWVFGLEFGEGGARKGIFTKHKLTALRPVIAYNCEHMGQAFSMAEGRPLYLISCTSRSDLRNFIAYAVRYCKRSKPYTFVETYISLEIFVH